MRVLLKMLVYYMVLSNFLISYSAPCKTCLIADKCYNLNQKMFFIHSKIKKFIFKPMIVIYKILPRGFKIILRRFYKNLEFILFRGLNALLQKDFRGFIIEARKFVIKTVVGLGNTINLSKKFNKKIEKKHSSAKYTFTHTLEKYGLKHKYYFFLPGLGPVSLLTFLDNILTSKINGYMSKVYAGYNIDNAMQKYKLIKQVEGMSKKMQVDEYSFYKTGFANYIKSQCLKCTKTLHK